MTYHTIPLVHILLYKCNQHRIIAVRGGMKNIAILGGMGKVMLSPLGLYLQSFGKYASTCVCWLFLYICLHL